MNRDIRSGRRKGQEPVDLPVITTAAGHELVCFPTATHAFIVNSYDQFLLFRRPGQMGWEVVTGEIRAAETVPDAVQRQLETDLGPAFLSVYLGVLDTFTFIFDANLPSLISICCLLRYRGGEMRQGKGVAGAEFKWWAISDLDMIDLAVPRGRWDLLTKAVDMSRYLRDARQSDDDLPGEAIDPEDDYRY